MRLRNLFVSLKQLLLGRLIPQNKPTEMVISPKYTGPEHPLKVYLPMAGRLFLVEWWTHEGQYHVILTKSEEKAIFLAKKLFANNRDSRVDAYWEIELAAPPTQLCESAAKAVRAQYVHDFLRDISFLLFDLEEAGKPLPALFVKCDNYQTPYARDDESVEYTNNEHWDCTNCIGSFKLANMTGDQFYDTYFTKWQAAHPVKYSYNNKYVNKNPIPKYSQAPTATDVTDLWMVTTDFGCHSHGVDLLQLDPNRVYIKPALFYFKIVRQLDITPVQNIIDTLKAEKKQQDVERSSALKKEREREKQKEIELTLAFFN